MKQALLLVGTAFVIAVLAIMGAFLLPEAAANDAPSAQQPALTHAQETWISALEWCESRGNIEAKNPMDRDGTPSYSSFQWKPSTLLAFGKKYGLIDEGATLDDVPKLIDDYELQRNIVRGMLTDKEITNAELRDRQFPGCIQNKIGLPPR